MLSPTCRASTGCPPCSTAAVCLAFIHTYFNLGKQVDGHKFPVVCVAAGCHNESRPYSKYRGPAYGVAIAQAKLTEAVGVETAKQTGSPPDMYREEADEVEARHELVRICLFSY